MFPLRALIGVVAFAALASCSRQTPTSPPPPTVAPIQVSSLTISGLDGPLAAGSTASLRATAHMSDGTTFAVNEGAQWTSQNPDVVRVDTQGNIEAVREGETTINTEVKGASVSVPVTIVMNMTGVWSITYIPVSCESSGFLPGCVGRTVRPTQQIDAVTLSQTGDQISGEWLVPFEGRIVVGGRLLLTGQECYTSSYMPSELIAIDDWEMQRTADTDTFSGRAHWELYGLSSIGSCSGTRQRTGRTGDLQIIDFRRR